MKKAKAKVGRPKGSKRVHFFSDDAINTLNIINDAICKNQEILRKVIERQVIKLDKKLQGSKKLFSKKAIKENK
ncbi:MAG TPA: hypothetical protein VJ279_08250 [Hanamia sp.]|jgi:hypothetical protein|nr:hypothetical protein [Hanamia sp.]